MNIVFILESVIRNYFLLPSISSVSSENLIKPPVVSSGISSGGHNVIDLIFNSGPVVQLVLLVLAVASVLTWGIVIAKFFTFQKAKLQTDKFFKIFWTSRNLEEISRTTKPLSTSPVTNVFSSGYTELTKVLEGHSEEDELQSDFGEVEEIERALKQAKAKEMTRLETGTTFLATTASAAPFVGLFGTVWGVMNAFIGLSTVKTTSIQAVAPGISEALIATAVGLAAAIPATVAFNYFNQQIRVFSRRMDMFAAEFLNIANRHFL